MGLIDYLDSMLIPPSLLVMAGYHAYLWNHLNLNPRLTSIGIHTLKRRQWLLYFKEGDEKKAMLAIQSLRNTLMTTIFTATVTILMSLSLAALANNAYNASARVFRGPLFGSESGKMMSLKYGSASAMLMGSFLCSSISTGFFIDCNYLLTCAWRPETHTPLQDLLDKAYGMSVVANRMLCAGFVITMWLLGPLPVAFSSLALVWGLYNFDFPPRFKLIC